MITYRPYASAESLNTSSNLQAEKAMKSKDE